jgi:uncharacterized protein with HEPN domain
MQLRDRNIIEKIISETAVLHDIIENLDESAFLGDEVVKRAASMTLINIGELVKSLSDEIRTKNRDIPWKLIAGFRDVAAHKYQTLSMGDVWETISNDVPKLQAKLQALLTIESEN